MLSTLNWFSYFCRMLFMYSFTSIESVLPIKWFCRNSSFDFISFTDSLYFYYKVCSFLDNVWISLSLLDRVIPVYAIILFLKLFSRSSIAAWSAVWFPICLCKSIIFSFKLAFYYWSTSSLALTDLLSSIWDFITYSKGVFLLTSIFWIYSDSIFNACISFLYAMLSSFKYSRFWDIFSHLVDN